MKKPEILVSACLCGQAVRYDGRHNLCPKVKALIDDGTAVPFCPECEGGLPIPRCPSEIRGCSVVNANGEDCTAEFEEGARKALELCRKYGITKAILKEKSPSCGVHKIYDGSFSGSIIDGQGITTQLLSQNGISVISEIDL